MPFIHLHAVLIFKSASIIFWIHAYIGSVCDSALVPACKW